MQHFSRFQSQLQQDKKLAAALACPTLPKYAAMVVEDAIENYANPEAVLAVLQALKDGPQSTRGRGGACTFRGSQEGDVAACLPAIKHRQGKARQPLD